VNIAESFGTYLASLTSSTLGQDLFIGQAPSSNKAPDSYWLISTSGGSKTLKAQTSEFVELHQIEVRYKHRDYKTVYNTIQDLLDDLNSNPCTQLSGYDTIEIEATTYPIDDDLDSEDRKVGLLIVSLKIYKE